MALGHELTTRQGTTYSKYDTINQSFASAGQQIFQQAGCTQTTLADQVACLRAYNGTPELSSFGTVARYVVQDGSIVVTPKLEVATLNANVAHIPVCLGPLVSSSILQLTVRKGRFRYHCY